MKIRSDFVTNSSSSSFVLVKIKSKTFYDIIQRFVKSIENSGYDVTFKEDNEELSIRTGDCFAEVPYCKDNIVSCLMSLFDESDIPEEDLNSLMKEVEDKGKEISKDIKFAEWLYEDAGWGGEGESRYEKASYEKKDLKQIYEKISWELQKPTSQVTEEDFNEYVCDKTGVNREYYKYDRKKKISKYKHKYYLE